MTRMKAFNVLFLFTLFAEISLQKPILEDDGPIVQIQQGFVRGVLKSAVNSRPFYAFLGIPYAKPPIGNLRFKAPIAADGWADVFNATADPPMCVQPESGGAKGSEDCLQLSVYTPYLPSDNSSSFMLNVQVFIHGGSFVEGDINYQSLNPEFYMTSDIVLVVVSYRVGVLGFLSTNDAASSGNYGLLDQNLALQWVQHNVASFGGNKSDVTLVGQSAGSASVLFQILSPKSAGLFSRAIAESGSALCPWAVEENPLFYAQQLGNMFSCSNDSFQLVECLAQQDAAQLVSYGFDVMVQHLKLCFVPVVEDPVNGQFLTEDPLTILQNGNFNQVPLIMGVVRDEGTFIYRYIDSYFTVIDDAFFDIFMPVLVAALTDYRSNLINVSYAIKDEYYADVDLSNQTAINIASLNVISDMFMKSGIMQTVELISGHNVDVYTYAYDYVSNTSSSNYTGEPDVTHGNEMKYLFRSSFDMNAKDADFGHRFFNLWNNFMLYGNPTPSGSESVQWQLESAGQDNYYEINEIFNMMGPYEQDKMNFWWNIVPSIVNA